MVTGSKSCWCDAEDVSSLDSDSREIPSLGCLRPMATAILVAPRTTLLVDAAAELASSDEDSELDCCVNAFLELFEVAVVGIGEEVRDEIPDVTL